MVFQGNNIGAPNTAAGRKQIEKYEASGKRVKFMDYRYHIPREGNLMQPPTENDQNKIFDVWKHDLGKNKDDYGFNNDPIQIKGTKR